MRSMFLLVAILTGCATTSVNQNAPIPDCVKIMVGVWVAPTDDPSAPPESVIFESGRNEIARWAKEQGVALCPPGTLGGRYTSVSLDRFGVWEWVAVLSWTSEDRAAQPTREHMAKVWRTQLPPGSTVADGLTVMRQQLIQKEQQK